MSFKAVIKHLIIVFAVTVGITVLHGCESKAKPFKGEIYKSLDNQTVVSIYSKDELEIKVGNEPNVMAKYTIEEDGSKLRVVLTSGGSPIVVYFDITKDGIVGKNILYSTARLEEKFTEIHSSLTKPVLVKGGCFDMGDTFGDEYSNEKPVHEVCVNDFYIGKYEVTQRQWFEVMGSNPSHFKNCDYCPVESVSWNDIQEFIKRLNQKTGNKYRLPTEAEWEYAARSGGKKEKWAGTSNESELVSYAWYYNKLEEKTHIVGQKKPNGLGLHDMSGNVFEWCQDWYDENYYKNSPKDNPNGPSNGQHRVLRGGSWLDIPRDLRSASRFGNSPGDRGYTIGFRCVMTK